jgi:cellulose synthase/poly-beta-1,6-N-acetylglucosamine synthase-like glycosyltransferase
LLPLSRLTIKSLPGLSGDAVHSLDYLFAFFLAALFVQGAFNLYLTLYVWEDPNRLQATKSPDTFAKPRIGFTVLLPARHEEAVIGQTITRLLATNYPARLLQIILVCDAGDTQTMAAGQAAIDAAKATNARVIAYSGLPINKPHGLNFALTQAKFPVVTIFDAEDDVSPNIFHVANTIFLEGETDVIQAGVQLMNYATSWYSVHNVLEYYFWFKSRMHYHASEGMVPLGGNTVFFKTKQLRAVGGWDQDCLTEDGDIGIRLSLAGAKIRATYDAGDVTKEETPGTIAQFIKQRTRWNQGFIQILKKREWRKFPRLKQRLLAIYVLSFPIVQAVLFFITPLVIIFGVLGKLSIGLSLFSFLPLIILVIQLGVNLIGLWEFTHEQGLPFRLGAYLAVIWGFLPYQFLLSIAAVRGSVRELRGINNWEKTAHTGEHRYTEKVMPL